MEGERRARQEGEERVQRTEEARSRKGGHEIRAGAKGGAESRRRGHLVDVIQGCGVIMLSEHQPASVLFCTHVNCKKRPEMDVVLTQSGQILVP